MRSTIRVTMTRFIHFKIIFAALIVAGLMAGCDTDYDTTADLQTEQGNEQITSDTETSTTDDSTAYDAANPAFNSADPDYASIYDNEQPVQTSEAGTEETVYFQPDLATLSQDEESDLRQFAESIRGQDLSQMQISIESYAASNSTPEYDKQLSELRAETVREFLQSEGIDVANWDMKTLANDRLPESALQERPADSGGAISDGTQPGNETATNENNRVIVSLVPYSGQQDEQLGSIN